LAEKTARNALHNHTTLIVLFFNFIILTIDLPLLMNYYNRKAYVPFNPAICLVNQFVDYGIWYGTIMTMLWLSIERHILIFHSNLVRTARGRWLFHYIPLVLFTLYAPVFYFYLIFIYPCEHQYSATAYVCGGPWYACTFSPSLMWFRAIFHGIVPIMLIIGFTGGLLLRVIIQKRNLQRANGWRKNRKMILQFIAISFIYIIFDGPVTIINTMKRLGITYSNTNFVPFLSLMEYVPSILMSYAIVITLPKLKQKLRMLIFCQPNRQIVHPINPQT